MSIIPLVTGQRFSVSGQGSVDVVIAGRDEGEGSGQFGPVLRAVSSPERVAPARRYPDGLRHKVFGHHRMRPALRPDIRPVDSPGYIGNTRGC